MSYPPAYYTDDNPAYARRIMAEHGFALLVVDGLAATHLPLSFKAEGERGAVYGHIAKTNPIAHMLGAADASEGVEALAVFSGPHGYVSATLLGEADRTVPTWNYASVQLRGRLRGLPESEIMPHLTEIAGQYESPDAWSVADAPDYVAALQSGIIAVRLEVESLTAFRKMSSNKPPAIQKRIIDAARARGEQAFADEMAKAMPKT